MHGPAFSRSILLPAAITLCALVGGGPASAASQASPPSLVQAFNAAEASLRRIPGDDIESDFRPVWTAVADLDGDGRADIVAANAGNAASGGTGGARPSSALGEAKLMPRA